MSTLSKWTIGAIASKKASCVSPVRPAIAVASAGEVRGPEATITLSQAGSGRPSISSRRISISGWASRASVMAAAKPSRSTASAPPAGTWWASAARITSEPQARSSAWSTPTALVSASSERSELEQTSSPSRSVACASVERTGRISCSTTGTPRDASAQAASEPARPPPTT